MKKGQELALAKVQRVDKMEMTSLEIAELTGKRHHTVLRDIKELLEELEFNQSKKILVEYKDQKGEMRPMYSLDSTLTLTVITGYFPQLRYAIIKRWQELESLATEMLELEITQKTDTIATLSLDFKQKLYRHKCATAELKTLETLSLTDQQRYDLTTKVYKKYELNLPSPEHLKPNNAESTLKFIMELYINNFTVRHFVEQMDNDTLSLQYLNVFTNGDLGISDRSPLLNIVFDNLINLEGTKYEENDSYYFGSGLRVPKIYL